MEVGSLMDGHSTDVASLMDSHSTDVASLMEGAWSCYRGGQYNLGRMVMLRRWPV